MIRSAALEIKKMRAGPEKLETLSSSRAEARTIWCCCCNGEGPLQCEMRWFRDETAGQREFVPFFSSREAVEDTFAGMKLAAASSMPPFKNLTARLFFRLVKAMNRPACLNPYTDSEVRISLTEVSVLHEMLTTPHPQAMAESNEEPLKQTFDDLMIEAASRSMDEHIAKEELEAEAEKK
jgi:hypothetical protein